MILRWLPVALFAIVFAPGLLHAQRQVLKTEIIYVVEDKPNSDKMYEDIEILRRILDRKLTPLYPSETNPRIGSRSNLKQGMFMLDYGFGTDASNTQWIPNPHQGNSGGIAVPTLNVETNPVVIPIRSLEGVYLKGQGVVYTATLSSLQRVAKAEADFWATKGPVEPVLKESEWESIRHQIRNEKEKPKKPEASKPPSLSDVLLKVLAENGHHFSQLGENESLILVLTVHSASPSAPAAKSGRGSAKSEAKPAVSGSYSGSYSGPREEVRDSELLGELHLKQGKHGEAIKAFHYVLKRTSDPKREAELHRKLAQCYLMQGQDEQARTELDQAIALMKKETEAKGKTAPATKPAPALPVKLIISAPKKLLDQAKAGKITFEEFRRQAHVETLRFNDHR